MGAVQLIIPAYAILKCNINLRSEESKSTFQLRKNKYSTGLKSLSVKTKTSGLLMIALQRKNSYFNI